MAMTFRIAAVLLVSFLSVSSLQAREIRLHFPHFPGERYEWKIFQGPAQHIVGSGVIPRDGRVTLKMPDAFRDYRGMTRWMLKKGGGLDMIYTGKGFSVECLSPKPSGDTIVYTGNPENEYLKARARRQKTILAKLGAINHMLQVYGPDETLHKTALIEQADLRGAFERVQADRAKSLFYAARFGEIVDFTRGIADRVYENRADHTAYFNDFVTRTLDFEDLYTSGHWDQVIHQWLMMNIRPDRGNQAVISRLDMALSRINRDDLAAAFVENVVPLLVEKGKDDLLPIISAHLESCPGAWDALPERLKNSIASVKILTGKKGPDLKLYAPVRTGTGTSNRDIRIETGRPDAGHTILLFYQGECGLCEDALIDLANQYQWLTERNVRVVALSADTTRKGFEKKLAYHQWPDNYCDFTGMAGENFRNYGVLGVPTLFLLDRHGVVVKKTAMVDEITAILKKNNS